MQLLFDSIPTSLRKEMATNSGAVLKCLGAGMLGHPLLVGLAQYCVAIAGKLVSALICHSQLVELA